jgi:ABC-type multidrug transport system fused ATPase/permease subunit
MPQSNEYWFPAKRYGWGWGAPIAWQGWVILLGWIAVLIAGALRLMPAHPVTFLLLAVAMAALLTFICYLTGEPPRWRWGAGNE